MLHIIIYLLLLFINLLLFRKREG